MVKATYRLHQDMSSQTSVIHQSEVDETCWALDISSLLVDKGVETAARLSHCLLTFFLLFVLVVSKAAFILNVPRMHC